MSDLKALSPGATAEVAPHPPLGPPEDPGHNPTVGSYEVAFYYTPVTALSPATAEVAGGGGEDDDDDEDSFFFFFF